MSARSIPAALFALVAAAALLAFAATLAAHVAAHRHIAVPPEQWRTLGSSLFSLWTIVGLIAVTEQAPNNRRFWSFVFRGTPRWMARAVPWLAAYACLNVGLLISTWWFGGLGSLGGAEVKTWSVTGILLVFHWIAFVAVFAKLVRLGRDVPHCPNNHAVAADHRHCTRCGTKVEGFHEYQDVD